MHVSVNELMLTSQKAALGAGVSAGAGEDLGNVAVWLGARGFPVIEAVHDALLAAQSGTSVYGKATVNEHRAEWAPQQAGQALSAALVGGACAKFFRWYRGKRAVPLPCASWMFRCCNWLVFQRIPGHTPCRSACAGSTRILK